MVVSGHVIGRVELGFSRPLTPFFVNPYSLHIYRREVRLHIPRDPHAPDGV